MLQDLKTLKSGYLDIFKIPQYYHLAFERNSDWEVAMILDKYRDIFHKEPVKIVDFFCANACYGRNLLKKGYDTICYDPSPEFISFVTDCLKVDREVCTSDINSTLLENADIYLFLFDNIAYINPNEVVELIDVIYEKMGEQGMLFILSNSGTDLSYLDYSKKYLNDGMDKNLLVKAGWSINEGVELLNGKVNYVGKRVSVIDKNYGEILDSWEHYSDEASYNRDDMLKIHAKSLFSKHSDPLFYSDFYFSKYDSDGPEVVSVFMKC